MINLFTYKNYDFTLLNLILIVSVISIWYFTRRWISKNLENFNSTRDWHLLGKEKKLKSFIKQLHFILFCIIGFKVLTFNNPDFSFSNILDIELFGFDGNEGRFSFTIGSIIFLLTVFIVTKLIVSTLKIVIHKSSRSKNWIDEGRRYTFIQLTKYFVSTIAIIIAIQGLGFNITFLIAGSAALFVGVGLGLQSVLGDVFSGIILLFDGSVKVGDIVELPIEGICKVQNIYIRTSQVKTLDGKFIIVPNSKLTTENVINLTISDKATRFHVKVGVAYGSNTQLVKELLYTSVIKHPLVEKRRNIVIMFDDFGDYALQFKVYFWVKRNWEILNIKSDIRFNIDQHFRENGIKIPFPQRDLHLISDKRNDNDSTDQLKQDEK
jgi:small-conductance mechanosensitive channel